jgi:putative aldouronate transport system permease protein
MLAPIVTMLTLLSIGRIFYSDFGMLYFLTRNSTALYSITDVIDTYVFRALRSTGDIGMAAAAGFYQSVVGFILILTSNLVVRKANPEYSIF